MPGLDEEKGARSSPRLPGSHLLWGGKVCLFRLIRADVAQLVEQLICNQQVRGSIPLVSSVFRGDPPSELPVGGVTQIWVMPPAFEGPDPIP